MNEKIIIDPHTPKIPYNPLLFLAFTLNALLGVPRGSQGKDSEPV